MTTIPRRHSAVVSFLKRIMERISMSFHLDPRVTWAQIITIITLVFASGAAWHQLDQLSDSMEMIARSVQQQGDRLSNVEERASVLEMQRVEDNRRLDEIRTDVRYIRENLEQRQ